MTEQQKRRSPSRGAIEVAVFCARSDDHTADLEAGVLDDIEMVINMAGWAMVRGRVLCPECLAELGYDTNGNKLPGAGDE